MRRAQYGWVTPENMALFTDMYELTMADSYLRHGMDQWATFDLFIRHLPPQRAFLLNAGLEPVVHYLLHMRFTQEAIEYLREQGIFSDAFLSYLRTFRFTGDVWAMPEGTVFFPGEPVLRVSAPRIQAQILETALLNITNAYVTFASKAARVVLAAQGRAVADFSPRRDHGMDAALKVARAAYIAGCAATSNVLAGHLFGIPITGTMAHSYVMSFPTELDAFRAYAADYPNNAVLLIDTYDTIQGAKHAIIVARELRARGYELRGVRIDSGDLVALSREVRRLLDEAGFPHVQIFLSGDLDEYRIRDLLAAGAVADAFGVGTRMGTSADAPYVGGVYKLVEDETGLKIKLSTGKLTLPGRKQVYRSYEDGRMRYDVIALADEPPPEGTVPLLREIIRKGELVADLPTLSEIRERAAREMRALPDPLREIDVSYQDTYPVRISAKLRRLTEAVQAHVKRSEMDAK
ncbi:MAG: nicotinate phosphoribosyltransferase [Chloroflexi bacterium]|nr:nicotinate phosphoribosyltransferase [Chloroflexota bacterium]